MSVQSSATPESPAISAALAPTSPPPPSRSGGFATAGLWMLARTVAGVALTAAFTVGLMAAGLDVGPGLGAVAYSAPAPPRRPPIIPPSVPLGAREDWAIWSYVDKINLAWGKDWPLAIQWFEELDARYPGNPMVLDKLYVAYLEDARVRQMVGDLQGARDRYERAARYDPDRGVAQERLAELDTMERAARR